MRSDHHLNEWIRDWFLACWFCNGAVLEALLFGNWHGRTCPHLVAPGNYMKKAQWLVGGQFVIIKSTVLKFILTYLYYLVLWEAINNTTFTIGSEVSWSSQVCNQTDFWNPMEPLESHVSPPKWTVGADLTFWTEKFGSLGATGWLATSTIGFPFRLWAITSHDYPWAEWPSRSSINMY